MFFGEVYYLKEVKYSGINKLIKSESLQVFINKIYDGTFSEFIDDWKWIFSFSKKYRWIILLYTIVGIFGSSLSLGASYVSRILINIIVGNQADKVWVLLGSMIGMTVFSLVLSCVSSRIFMKIAIYVNNDIQAQIFDKIMDARWRELSEYPSGDLLNRFNNDVGTISANAINWIPNLIVNIYTFIVTFIVIFRTDHTMAWITFLSAPFLLAMSRYIMRKMKEYRKRVLELNSNMMSFEVETFYNFDMIKSFGIFGFYSKRLRMWQQKFKEFNLDYNKFEIKSKILMSIVSTFVSLVAFGYCLFRLWTGQIQYGDMTFFLQQRSGLSTRFNSLVGTIPGMLNSAVSAHRIRELNDLPREKHDPEGYKELEKNADKGFSIKLKNVTFGYNEEEKSIYNNAEFEAKPGEIVAVLATSGGGKTTLMRLLLGMLDADSGSVTLTGDDGTTLPMNADLRRFFSYVPQGNTMLAGTIADNMRMVREDASDEEIIEALKTACAWEFVELIPGGINGNLGERGRGISEGQAQRISIARAILRNSPILLLDEATSALDIETEERVLKNIIKQHPNKIVIISTHRPSALKLCQHIYKITDGKIIETSENEATQIMWQYAYMPQNEMQNKPIIKPSASLSPKNESEIMPDEVNEGWWDV